MNRLAKRGSTPEAVNESALFRAIASGSLEGTREALASGEPIDQFDSEGQTPLMRAAQLPQRNILVSLFHKARDRGGTTNPQQALIDCILEQKPKLDLRSYNGWPALFYAIRSKNAALVERLADAGADLNIRDLRSRTALMMAAIHGLESTIQLLIDRGADVNEVDRRGQTALDYANMQRGSRQSRAGRKRLKAQGAISGEPSRLAFVSALHHLMTNDELVQSEAPLGVLTFIFILLLVFAGGSLLALAQSPYPADFLSIELFAVFVPFVMFSVVAVAAGYVYLVLFTSILQLPYQLITRTSESRQEQPDDATKNESRPSFDSELDAVNSFMRLGWGSLTKKVRTEEEQRVQVSSHLASIALAVAVGAALVMEIVTDVFFPYVLAFIAVACLLERPLRKGRLNAVQSIKDRAASNISARLDPPNAPTDEESGFILYLRTFDVTGKLTLRGMDFEAAIAYNIAPYLPMIALGQPGEAIGAGRVLTTEQEWRDEVKRLASRASLVMVVPSHRDGTVWEIMELKRSNSFDKTIFTMPPDTDYGDGRYADEWGRAVEKLRSLGLELPSHLASGLLFKLSNDGQLSDHLPLEAEPFLEHMLMQPPGGGGDGGDGDGDGDGGSGGDGGGGD